MAKIFGYCPSPNGIPVQTSKAVRVTVLVVDGEVVTADTCWLPRSISEDLQIKRVENEGVVGFEVRATVPNWWIRKLDIRPAWQKQGMSAPPMAQRPW